MNWKTTVDISVSLRPHNKSGTWIFMKFCVDFTQFKANPKYHFLISYTKQYRRDEC
jgi:hypothetical protein